LLNSTISKLSAILSEVKFVFETVILFIYFLAVLGFELRISRQALHQSSHSISPHVCFKTRKMTLTVIVSFIVCFFISHCRSYVTALFITTQCIAWVWHYTKLLVHKALHKLNVLNATFFFIT
jgi:hypothetical protein